MSLVSRVRNPKTIPETNYAANADPALSRKLWPDQVRLWHLYFVLHLGILALTVDPVRENSWPRPRKLAVADRAAMKLSLPV
jgi:hypothetical protein